MPYTPPVYPDAIPTETGPTPDLPDRQDDIDWLYAARYNELKKELIAALTELGTDPKGSYADVKTRLDDAYHVDQTTPQTITDGPIRTSYTTAIEQTLPQSFWPFKYNDDAGLGEDTGMFFNVSAGVELKIAGDIIITLGSDGKVTATGGIDASGKSYIRDGDLEIVTGNILANELVGIGTNSLDLDGAQCQIQNKAGGRNILLAGYYMYGGGIYSNTEGIIIGNSYSGTGNRQICFVASEQFGSDEYYGFRMICGCPVPIIDCVRADGAATGNLIFCQSGMKVGIGFDYGTLQSDITHTLTVNGIAKANGVLSYGSIIKIVPDDVEGQIKIKNADTDGTHIEWTYSKRSNNEDLWIYAYDGTDYKNFVKFIWDTNEVVFTGPITVGATTLTEQNLIDLLALL
jgi:hypothetical protein